MAGDDHFSTFLDVLLKLSFPALRLPLKSEGLQIYVEFAFHFSKIKLCNLFPVLIICYKFFSAAIFMCIFNRIKIYSDESTRRASQSGIKAAAASFR